MKADIKKEWKWCSSLYLPHSLNMCPILLALALYAIFITVMNIIYVMHFHCCFCGPACTFVNHFKDVILNLKGQERISILYGLQ